MLFMMMPFAPAMINDYFSAPSMGTILSLSGGVGITILPSFAAVILLIRVFPQKAGEKRFQEQLQLVPSEKRRLCFYNEYVEVTGKFRKKLSYTELKRTGETRNLYLLYFKDNKIVYVPKDKFRKGTLRELKSFISRRRTWGSKCYGVIRWLPVLFFLLVCCRGIWEG